MKGIRQLAVRVAWVAAAFAVHTAFVMVEVGLVSLSVFVIYALSLAATFALHEKTRGAVTIVIAFGVTFALLAEGVFFAAIDADYSVGRRLGTAFALSLPLVALVARRWSRDEVDDWFRAHVRRVVPVAMAIALPLLLAGVFGARGSNPAPYERAVVALGYNPFGAVGDRLAATMSAMVGGISQAVEDGGSEALLLAIIPEAIEARAEPELRRREVDRTGQSQRRLTLFLSPWSGVPRPVQDEVRLGCGRFAASDPERAAACAHELLVARGTEIRKRRDAFRGMALVSALPWAIAALFAWRGRRGRPGVHAVSAV